MLKDLIFENPNWDYRSFNVEKDAAFAEKKLGKTLDAFDPDLTRFRDRGGRLLLYHGRVREGRQWILGNMEPAKPGVFRRFRCANVRR